MRIVVLAGGGPSTNILLNWLADNGYDQAAVIIEARPTRAQIVRYRLKRLGVIRTLGEVLFMLLAVPVIQRNSSSRRRDILAEHGLRDEAPMAVEPVRVETVNCAEVKSLLRSVRPDVVLVNGTRIIKSDVLNAVPAVFLNIHAGITPEYRGVHGGYWSRWNNDAENFGVTLHMVDAGVDTGAIVAQSRITPSVRDNFSSYPALQQAVALPLLSDALEKIRVGQSLQPTERDAVSGKQWFHPTLWEYVVGYFRGVR